MAEDYVFEKQHYDLLIIGTGLQQSIISAASAKIGKSVLHLDPNKYYGGTNRSMNFLKFKRWIEKAPKHSEPFFGHKAVIRALGSTDSTKLESRSSEFCIDLSPNLIFSGGEFVDSLKPGAASYMDFIPVDEILIFKGAEGHRIPFTSSDAFEDKTLSFAAKHKLFKLFQKCKGDSLKFSPAQNIFGVSEALSKYINKPFTEFLSENELSGIIRDFVIYILALRDTENEKMEKHKTLSDRALEPLSKMTLFANSFGIYSKGPFIFPQYGMGQITDSFCRSSSVFGTTFMLNATPRTIKITDSKKISVQMTSGQCVTFDGVVCGFSFLERFENNPFSEISKELEPLTEKINPKENLGSKNAMSRNTERSILRAVCISDGPIGGSGGSFFGVVCPVNEIECAVRILQLSSDTEVCPQGMYLSYFSTLKTENSVEFLKKTIEKFFSTMYNDETEEKAAVKTPLDDGLENNKTKENSTKRIKGKPKLIYSALYSQKSVKFDFEESLRKRKNVFPVEESFTDLGFNDAFLEAKAIFEEMYPGAEFHAREGPAQTDWHQEEAKAQLENLVDEDFSEMSSSQDGDDFTFFG